LVWEGLVKKVRLERHLGKKVGELLGIGLFIGLLNKGFKGKVRN